MKSTFLFVKKMIREKCRTMNRKEVLYWKKKSIRRKCNDEKYCVHVSLPNCAFLHFCMKFQNKPKKKYRNPNTFKAWRWSHHISRSKELSRLVKHYLGAYRSLINCSSATIRTTFKKSIGDVKHKKSSNEMQRNHKTGLFL